MAENKPVEKPEQKPNPWVDNSIRTTEKLEQKSFKKTDGTIKKNI